jgi:hypothetical protein
MSLSLEQRIFVIEHYFISHSTQCPTKECIKAFIRGKKNAPNISPKPRDKV